MEYTIEQKAVALLTNTLWWRHPESVSGAQVWSRLRDDLAGIELCDVQDPDAEYHIGDKPPRVLSELERELLAALEDCRRALELANFTGELAVVDAAIAKAKGEA